jgi:hypothetical protein|nr:MAG TPA: protein of unknown function (DUF4373) [Caudoviricetes sp.]
MANNKTGLSYYNVDTDRYQDMRIKRLKKDMGCRGVAVYDYILCEIYRVKGCFIEWDESTAFDVSEYFGLKESNVNEIVKYCGYVGLFDKELLSRGIITSSAIQRRYLEMCDRAKRKTIKIPEVCRIIPEESPKIPEVCDKVKKSKVNISSPNVEDIPSKSPETGDELTGIPEEFVTLWDGFKGKRKSLADDYNDFCKKTDGLTVDYVKLGYHAQLAKNVYFQTWLNDFFPKKFRCTLDTSVVEPTFQPIVADWLAYKSERGQTYRQRGFESFYARLMELSGGNADTARGIIEQSKANNWAGIFPLKTTNDYGRNADNRVAHGDITSDEFMRRCEERVRARLARTMAREMGTDGGGDA